MEEELTRARTLYMVDVTKTVVVKIIPTIAV